MEKTFSRAVAHRGLHGAGVAQNSVESFTAAWAAGARQIETDFFLLENGRILCVHDKRELMRVACEESFRDIAKLTAEDVAAIDIGKLAKTPAPVHMPYLEDVLATVPRDGIAQCEIKLYGAGFADKFDTAVREAGLSEMNILVTSFDDNALADFKLRHPGYDTLWLGAWLESAEGVANLGKAIARAREIGVKYVCPGASGALKAGFTREMADAVRASGLDVRLYGVNSPELLQYAADIGATGFTTDHWLDAFEWAKGVRNIVLESRKSTEAASVHVADGVCNVRASSGTAHGVSGGTVQDFTPITGASYLVRYFKQVSGAGTLRIPSLFEPRVVRAHFAVNCYAKKTGEDVMLSSLYKIRHYYFPYYYFTGALNDSLSQTEHGTVDLSGSCLVYEAEDASGTSRSYGYIVDEPV